MKISTLAVLAAIGAAGVIAYRHMTSSEVLEVPMPEEALPETPVLVLPAPTLVETQAE